MKLPVAIGTEDAQVVEVVIPGITVSMMNLQEARAATARAGVSAALQRLLP